MTEPEQSADVQSFPRAAASLNGATLREEAQRSHRSLMVGLLVTVLALACLLVVLRVFFAQRTTELTEPRLAEAEELWERAGPANYDMDIEIRGARPGRVHIEVRDDEVTAMMRDGHTPPKRTWNVWSVPGLFETLERELQLAEDPVHEMNAAAGTQLTLGCDFDPQFGYPRQYQRFVSGGGPEVFWQVIRFELK
jgi:hypothetical protein